MPTGAVCGFPCVLNSKSMRHRRIIIILTGDNDDDDDDDDDDDGCDVIEAGTFKLRPCAAACTHHMSIREAPTNYGWMHACMHRWENPFCCP